MNIQEVTKEDTQLLEKFIQNEIPSTFRYFKNKTVDQIIKHHYKTYLVISDEVPVGYAHIDYDFPNDKYWVGFCVLESHQGKGIGSLLMKKILEEFEKSNIITLYLSVDKSNVAANKLYTKYGFQILRSSETVHFMSLTKQLFVPVSFGEAIDKLTILDIKMDKIKDTRRSYVELEYTALLGEIKHLLPSISFYYEALKTINLGIWEDQDIFRYSNNEEEKTTLCKKIIEDNDARFRIKNKINFYLNSQLKEQKGYNPKTATIHYSSTPELADKIYAVIKYKSIFNDKVIVHCSKDTIEQVKSLFKDDCTIIIESVDSIPSNKELMEVYLKTKSNNYFDFVEKYFEVNK